ncbi:RNA polymerase-associated protein LEO1-like [Strongylocentrotus purpuratus]|uniref:Uncharacterized protein n=1 Tax=Strongylocentrotus purpuratus TaxID=7668 RepID=A0A7M7NTV4_STRPU|nr:RNA polymerase-associated protein LEO1-like [Strongylocentrotus purpuratus]|eukprot:XP_011681174.1 PREDICTED: RNA polymerase-associated protein LEO1-like [Strongylocentrotus purpuratus]
MDEEAQGEEGHDLEPHHDDEDLGLTEMDSEHHLEPEHENDDNTPTDIVTGNHVEEYEEENDLESHHDDEDLELTETDSEHHLEHEHGDDDNTPTETGTEHHMEPENDDKGSSLNETDTNPAESPGDDEELSSPRDIDSDLNKSDSLPSLPDSEQQSFPTEETNDNSYQAAQNGDRHMQPSQSVKQERGIANALPDDFDLLAEYDDDSVASSQDATKLTWSAAQIAFLISAPLFFVGLALVIMGAINFPPTFNLLTIGIPVFIIALIVFIGSTAYLCFYKANKMKLFEFGGDMEGTGEIAGVGNMVYTHDDETMVPNSAYDDHDQEMMPSHQGGDDMTLSQDGVTMQPSTMVYTTEDQGESLPL